MAIAELDKFREKYPQYKDINDGDLANRLAIKYPQAYGDLPKKVAMTANRANPAMQGGALSPANVEAQKPSVATQGLGYLKEHPFLSALQGLPQTLTGKTMEQRAVESTQSPNFMQSKTVPFDKFLPQARQAAENRIIGGQLIDQATAPANFLGPLLGKASEITGLTNAINTLGKPIVAKVMSAFSGVNHEDILKAINNPNILNNQWLEKEGNIVKDIYKNQITPAVENLSNRVNTLGTAEKLQKEIKLSIGGEENRAAATMSNTEKDKIVGWLDELKKGDISLNRLDAMIGEMDKGLGKVYRKQEQMKLEPISSTFEALTTKMRGMLKGTRDEQYKELAPLFDRYANYKTAQKINQSMSSWHPKLMNVAKTSALLGISGIHNPELYGIGATAAIPKVQGIGIELGGALSKVPSQIPVQYAISQEQKQNQ